MYKVPCGFGVCRSQKCLSRMGSSEGKNRVCNGTAKSSSDGGVDSFKDDVDRERDSSLCSPADGDDDEDDFRFAWR